MRIILLLAALVISGYSDVCATYQYVRPDVFTVTGTGTLSLQPTIGTVVLGISVLDPVASVALRQANKLLNNAVRLIIINRVSAIQKAVQSDATVTFTTTGLSVTPEYTSKYNADSQNYVTNFAGYRVLNTLSVRTHDLTLMGAIIDKGIYSGLNNVQSVSFDLDPKQKQDLKESLIDNAVRDAVARAKLALVVLGMEIVSVKSVYFNEYVPQPVYYAKSALMASDAAAPTQVFAQEQQVKTTVQVGFTIRKSTTGISPTPAPAKPPSKSPWSKTR